MSGNDKKKSAGVMIVTGASRGIGADGVLGIIDDDRVAGGTARAIQADVASEADVIRLFNEADRMGRLSALVNNAAITGPLGRLEALPDAALRRVLEVNVAGAIRCAREAVRRMSTRAGGAGGGIVNISSRAALLGSPGEWVHYAASKGAIETMTVGLAREVAAEGIRVNAVALGLIATGMHAASGLPDRIEQMAPTIPMQRAGTPEEAAAGVLWLLSPAAAYVTGAIIPVAGGR